MAALKKDKLKQSAMREALAFFREMRVGLTDEQISRLIANGTPGAGEEDDPDWKKVPFPAHAMVPFTELQPLNADELSKVSERMKGLLGAVVAGFASKVPELMFKLAADSPERALKLWMEMGEFVVPKLTRTETSGSIEHTATFVAVEARDADPRSRAALPGPQSNNTITVEAEIVPREPSKGNDMGSSADTEDALIVTADRDQREQGPSDEADPTAAPSN